MITLFSQSFAAILQFIYMLRVVSFYVCEIMLHLIILLKGLNTVKYKDDNNPIRKLLFYLKSIHSTQSFGVIFSIIRSFHLRGWSQ